VLTWLRRLFGATSSTPDRDTVTPAEFTAVVYETLPKYAGMTEREIAYHRDNRVGR